MRREREKRERERERETILCIDAQREEKKEKLFGEGEHTAL